MDHTSHSRMETFMQCGEKARLRYIERVTEIPSIASVAGRAFHSACDAIDRNITGKDNQ